MVTYLEELFGHQQDIPDWYVNAVCNQVDPEAFFPEKGGSTREAKKTCTGCEVRAECLTFALNNQERYGIWGGLSERERRRIQRQIASKATSIEVTTIPVSEPLPVAKAARNPRTTNSTLPQPFQQPSTAVLEYRSQRQTDISVATRQQLFKEYLEEALLVDPTGIIINFLTIPTLIGVLRIRRQIGETQEEQLQRFLKTQIDSGSLITQIINGKMVLTAYSIDETMNPGQRTMPLSEKMVEAVTPITEVTELEHHMDQKAKEIATVTTGKLHKPHLVIDPADVILNRYSELRQRFGQSAIGEATQWYDIALSSIRAKRSYYLGRLTEALDSIEVTPDRNTAEIA